MQICFHCLHGFVINLKQILINLKFNLFVEKVFHSDQYCFEPRHDKTNKMSVRPAKTQISLDIRPIWSASSLSAWRKLGSLATHWANSEDYDQTGRMPRMIWVFAGPTLILLVLACRGSFLNISLWQCVRRFRIWTRETVTPHLPNRHSHSYQLGESDFSFKGCLVYFFSFVSYFW